MSLILTIGGSPSDPSRTAGILDFARQQVEARGFATRSIIVRHLNTDDLIYGRYNSPTLQSAFETVRQADGIIIATPIYKAAYSGVLKTFFDVLPPNAFAHKVVLPIASGGSLVHSLVIDYALRPVLTALGSTHILGGVYLIDAEMQTLENGGVQLQPAASERLIAALDALTQTLSPRSTESEAS